MISFDFGDSFSLRLWGSLDYNTLFTVEYDVFNQDSLYEIVLIARRLSHPSLMTLHPQRAVELNVYSSKSLECLSSCVFLNSALSLSRYQHLFDRIIFIYRVSNRLYKRGGASIAAYDHGGSSTPRVARGLPHPTDCIWPCACIVCKSPVSSFSGCDFVSFQSASNALVGIPLHNKAHVIISRFPIDDCFAHECVWKWERHVHHSLINLWNWILCQFRIEHILFFFFFFPCGFRL